MDDHNTHPLSESEQMYLLTVAMLAEEGSRPPIPLAALAEARAIQPVSANQMVRKLAESGLVTYTPYKGVALTEEGEGVAMRILRYRRLWEVFLADTLGMPAEAADALACRIEHLTDEDVAGRLARFLGEPRVSPSGRPIPAAGPADEGDAWLPLPCAPLGAASEVMRVEADPAVRAFLAAEGLRPGAGVAVMAAGAGGDLLLDVGGRSARLSAAVAARVLVRPAAAGRGPR